MITGVELDSMDKDWPETVIEPGNMTSSIRLKDEGGSMAKDGAGEMYP
jgi:hypothetical protein